MIAVEVRQGTLSADGRGGGPAGNTERRWSWFRADSTTTTKEGCPGWRFRADSTTTKEEEKKDEEEQEEQANIKSNNPHLTGGE